MSYSATPLPYSSPRILNILMDFGPAIKSFFDVKSLYDQPRDTPVVHFSTTNCSASTVDLLFRKPNCLSANLPCSSSSSTRRCLIRYSYTLLIAHKRLIGLSGRFSGLGINSRALLHFPGKPPLNCIVYNCTVYILAKKTVTSKLKILLKIFSKII